MIWVFSYTLECPVLALKTQFPPTLSFFSNTTNASPASAQFFPAAIPAGPAPITHTRFAPAIFRSWIVSTIHLVAKVSLEN